MMMKKLILVSFGSMLLLLSLAAACATNESEATPLEQTKPATTVPMQAQTTTDKTAPTKSVADQDIIKKPSPVPVFAGETGAVQAIPVKPATAPAIPVKPATAPTIPVKSATAPTIPVKPATEPAIPVKPATAPAIPAKPVTAPINSITPTKPASTNEAPAKQFHAPATRSKTAPSPAVTSKPESKQVTTSIKTDEPPVELFTHTVDIEVFMREGCLNCVKAKEFLDKLKAIQPQLKINTRDVRKEPAAMELLKRMAQNQGTPVLDYPAFVVGGQLFIGFTEEANTAQLILDNLPLTHSASDQPTESIEKCETGKEPSCGLIPTSAPAKTERITIDLLGYSIPIQNIGLPLFTVAMGVLDGLNHGSTWVLVLMISLLAPLKDRSRMLTIAGTFVAVQMLIYYVLMAAWLNFFLLINISHITELIVGGFALLAGVIYFKNYLYFGQTLSLSSQEISKPGIYTQIRKIVQAQSFFISLMGTVALAIIVQVSEFTFTSVFPALYTKLLTMQNLETLSNYGYLALYDFSYMLEDIIILSMAVITLGETRPQKSKGRTLLLASSVAMIGLGIYLLLMLR